MSLIGHFRLFMPGATSKPSPAVGQSLGPLGINMMNFCKDFNERTKSVRPEVPLQVTLLPRTDKTFKYAVRSPMTKWFVHRVSRVPLAGKLGSLDTVGNITLKELYHIAEAKSQDPQYIGIPLHAICQSVLGTCRAMGIRVTRERLLAYSKRDETPVWDLERLRKDQRQRNKAAKRGSKK